MNLARGIVFGTLLASPALAQDKTKEERLVLPSGLTAQLHEVIEQQAEGAPLYRYRFVAPDFTGAEEFDAQSSDLQHLCDHVAQAQGGGDRVVVSLADRPSEFGLLDPEVIQIFEMFRVENGACVWDMF